MRSASPCLGFVAWASLLVAGGQCNDLIERDVVIVGGGSSGTYSALKLKDQGHSVVVVERDSLLGGHVDTYYTASGEPVDYGVNGVFNNDLSKNYFRRLGVEHKPLLPGSIITDNVDFKTGKPVPGQGSLLTGLAALPLYKNAIAQFDFLKDGVYDLPNPVPAQLLRPFKEFVAQHPEIKSVLPVILTFAHVAGDILEAPLLYVLQLFGLPHVNNLQSGAYIMPKTGGMQTLYNAAAKALGEQNVLFNSTVVQAKRSGQGVELTVQTKGKDCPTIIKSKKLLLAMPPTLENLKPFDLDDTEKGILSKWTWLTYYVGVLSNTGLPEHNVQNLDDHKPEKLPTAPFNWNFQYSGVADHWTYKIVGPKQYTEQQAANLVVADLGRLNSTYHTKTPTFLATDGHNPSVLQVSTQEVSGGFYRQLYALEGRRSTFWTGNAFASDYSSILWAFSNTVIAKMDLGK